MFIWEQAAHLHRSKALAETFTPEERARLETLRERYMSTRHCAEFGVDFMYLCFVRWLVEHGRIGETEETLV